MPVVARQIQPAAASTRPLPKQLQNALEATAVFTVGSLIRQVSDLARLAEDLMGEMADEVGAISGRTKALERRMSVIQQHLAGMDVERESKRVPLRHPLHVLRQWEEHAPKKDVCHVCLPVYTMKSYASLRHLECACTSPVVIWRTTTCVNQHKNSAGSFAVHSLLCAHKL